MRMLQLSVFITSFLITGLVVSLSGCTSVYGPARLGMNTQIVNKPLVFNKENSDTSATYAGADYTRSSYLSNGSDITVDDAVNTFTLRAYRSYVKNRIAYSFGGAYSFGYRTFPYDSLNNSPIVNGRYNHSSATVFGEIAIPLIQSGSVNFYPVKAGFYYTYEWGESMDFLMSDVVQTEQLNAYTNSHMPAILIAHELMIQVQQEVIIGIDLGQTFTFNAQNYRDNLYDDNSKVFYSLRGSLSFTLDRYSLNFTGITGLHSGFNVGLTARLGVI